MRPGLWWRRAFYSKSQLKMPDNPVYSIMVFNKGYDAHLASFLFSAQIKKRSTIVCMGVIYKTHLIRRDLIH
jgi:hypothetical protein